MKIKVMIVLLSINLFAQGASAQHWVQSISPAQNAINVSNDQSINIEFSEAIANGSLTVDNIKVYSKWKGFYSIGFAFEPPSSLIISPFSNFLSGDQITVILSTAIQNIGGNTMPTAFVATFRVAAPGATNTLTKLNDVLVGSNPYALVAADFDQDGDTDLMTANKGSNNVTLLRNNGKAEFLTFDFPVGVGPEDIEAGDFDADGDMDVAVACSGTDNIYILSNLNNGGNFDNTQMVDVGDPPHGIAANDIDGDGDLDLITSNFSGSKVITLKNNGNGFFTNSATSFAGAVLEKAIIKDIENDGDLDVAVSSFSFGKLFLLENDGTGSFSELDDITVGNNPHIPTSIDLNGDGWEDYIVPNSGSANLHILFGDGNGGFSLGPLFTVFSQPWSIATFDRGAGNNSGLAVVAQAVNKLFIIANDGAGGLTNIQEIETGNKPHLVVTGDFDKNGTVDLAVCNENSNSVTIISNEAEVSTNDRFAEIGAVDVFPNPASEQVLLRLKLVESANVHIRLRNSKGQQMHELAQSKLASGEYNWQWNGTTAAMAPMPAGLYYFQIQLDESERTIPFVWQPQ